MNAARKGIETDLIGALLIAMGIVITVVPALIVLGNDVMVVWEKALIILGVLCVGFGLVLLSE